MAVLCAVDIPRTSPLASSLVAGRSSGRTGRSSDDEDEEDAARLVVWIAAGKRRAMGLSSSPGEVSAPPPRPLLKSPPNAPATASAASGAARARAWMEMTARGPMDTTRDVAYLSIVPGRPTFGAPASAVRSRANRNTAKSQVPTWSRKFAASAFETAA